MTLKRIFLGRILKDRLSGGGNENDRLQNFMILLPVYKSRLRRAVVAGGRRFFADLLHIFYCPKICCCCSTRRAKLATRRLVCLLYDLRSKILRSLAQAPQVFYSPCLSWPLSAERCERNISASHGTIGAISFRSHGIWQFKPNKTPSLLEFPSVACCFCTL